jgi:erythritol kinase
MRAVYEGIGFASRDCYRAMGLQPEEIRLTGGAARSDTFRAIFAAAVDAPIRVLDRAETGASGAALTAALALGHYDTVADGAAEWVAPYLGDAEPVDADLAARYADLFEAYREGYRGQAGVWSALERSRRQEGPQ